MNERTQQVLEWYYKEGRDLPWRVKGGAHPDPYKVLVSEFMLQQTTVATVLSYFGRFMEKFPTIRQLAAATEEEIFLLWQGLGYYSRARSLHAAAKEIVTRGSFPDTEEDLLTLKGIGPYTAASILSLAFNKPAVAVDGNVSRVISRLYYLCQPVPESLPEIKQHVAALADKNHAADFTSALMDLGATVCTPKKPSCSTCPLSCDCLAFLKGKPEELPVKIKKEKKAKRGFVHIIVDSQWRVYIRKRTEKGLLSGLYEFPWNEGDAPPSLGGHFEKSGITVSHVFTHFRLELELCSATCDHVPLDGFFVPVAQLEEYPFSTLMKKVRKAAFNAGLIID